MPNSRAKHTQLREFATKRKILPQKRGVQGSSRPPGRQFPDRSTGNQIKRPTQSEVLELPCVGPNTTAFSHQTVLLLLRLRPLRRAARGKQYILNFKAKILTKICLASLARETRRPTRTRTSTTRYSCPPEGVKDIRTLIVITLMVLFKPLHPRRGGQCGDSSSKKKQ